MTKKRTSELIPTDRNDWIRTSAYYKWERAGRPESDGLDFWLKAEKEYVAQNGQPQLAGSAAEEKPAFATSTA